MDHNNICLTLTGEPHALGIFKTLYLFLRHHNFPKAAEALRQEWGFQWGDIEGGTSVSLLLTRCECSKSQANQTEGSSLPKNRDEWLVGTFHGETFRVKPDDTHVFYVCDHCQHENNPNHEITDAASQQRNKSTDKYPLQDQVIPHTEANKLTIKFNQLQDEHKKLIAITTELTTALQMNIIGQTKNIHSVLEQCKSIYPSLFDNENLPVLQNNDINSECNRNNPSELHLEVVRSDEQDLKNRSSQVPNNSMQKNKNDVPDLKLDRLSPTTPLIGTPLTPETVRYILETVFQRIFDIEKDKNQGTDAKSPPLNRDEVERIVGDVINETIKKPANNGAGEGEFSRPVTNSPRDRGGNDSVYIDYGKLKSDIMHGDDEKKIRILQALRWRITKNDGFTRDKVLTSYVTHDVLDLFAAISIPERLLLGYGTDPYVQESTCRLINALASLRIGRDYLTLDERLLKRVLIKKIKDIRSLSGAVMRNMLIASVQKLSIRKQCRAQMVNDGLFEVMVDYLDDFYENLSKYCLEYCSALLMNLCLVEEAKSRSTKNPRKTVGLLNKFLTSDNEYCLPYINGVMFSLFEKSEMVNEAMTQNLDKSIVKIIQGTSNENIKKQLDFILQSRLFGKTNPNLQSDDEEGKEEIDLLEAELDQDDFITQLPSGEKLLQEYKAEDDNHNTEKTHYSPSFGSQKREAPNSCKSFCEETKQYHHKPSAERGIFEPAKPRRNTTCSQSLIKHSVKNKTSFNQSCGRYPATPLCYMENCQKLKSGGGGHCSCSRCQPGQSRYSCGCYDAIRQDIAEDKETDIFSGYKNTDPKISSQPIFTAAEELPTKPDNNQSVDKSAFSAFPNAELLENNEKSVKKDHGGRKNSGCKVCGEKKCECAFESRPKLCRTPTL